jgi:glucosamine-6-phosphate deaminase
MARVPDAPAPLVLADPRRIGLVAAELIVNRLIARPEARLLLPNGRTPAGMYAALRAHAVDGDLAAARPTILQLDEYAGIPPADPRSLAVRLTESLRGVPRAALRTIDGAAADLDAEAARHEAEIEGAPIDLAVLGLGTDGRVAFDEPPARRASGVHVVALAPETGRDVPADRALTVGLGTLYRARELLLLATGAAKAGALQAMLERPAGPACPASLLRDHPRLTVICDRAAASRLRPQPGWDSDRVLIVLGHREPGISAEHRISAESRARLRRAEAIARRLPVRAAVLTGYTSTGGLSEAEQMKTTWDEGRAPALLEVAGRDTAENASRSLPIILAIGEAKHVIVVSSAWHVRVPWFFAPYRRFGLHVGYRAAFFHGNWPRMLREELRQAPQAPRRRREAMAAVTG